LARGHADEHVQDRSGFTDEQNQARLADLVSRLEHVGKVLARSGQDLESVVARARSFR
jgi:hypothetical protein